MQPGLCRGLRELSTSRRLCGPCSLERCARLWLLGHEKHPFACRTSNASGNPEANPWRQNRACLTLWQAPRPAGPMAAAPGAALPPADVTPRRASAPTRSHRLLATHEFMFCVPLNTHWRVPPSPGFLQEGPASSGTRPPVRGQRLRGACPHQEGDPRECISEAMPWGGPRAPAVPSSSCILDDAPFELLSAAAAIGQSPAGSGEQRYLLWPWKLILNMEGKISQADSN